MDGINNQLACARKMALAGEYVAALQNLDGVLGEVER